MTESLQTQICIAGGGPAGMMLGLLTAKAGIDTLVLEKHADFLRDFRGDTVHPSTLEIFYDLGLLDRFLKRPHDKAEHVSAVVGGQEIPVADFSHLPTHAKFLAFMPQWDFLSFVKETAATLPTFHLRMETPVTGLVVHGQKVIGARARHGDADIEVRADLVVGTDGRHSTVRDKAGMKVHDLGSPIDVLWMRIPRHSDDPAQLFGRFDRGHLFIMLNRQDYWQCAYVIPKDGFNRIKEEGLAAFRKNLVGLAPFIADRVECLASWDDIKLLTVRVDRLEQWAKDGLLCIGDAAHAMSPVGGVGINLAIQDAVAAANLLVPALRRGKPTIADLNRVQERRTFPTKVTQGVQVQIHKRVLAPVLASKGVLKPPLVVKLVGALPLLRRLPARAIGIGVRPEHPDPQIFGRF